MRYNTIFNSAFMFEPEIKKDSRGYFLELYRADQYKNVGLKDKFVQENLSRSKKNVLRGLHFQWNPPLGKLIRVVIGKVFLVIVDIRKNSPHFKKWFGAEISSQNRIQIFAPFGFATGFCTLSKISDVQYLYTNHYNPDGESNIIWNDPELKINWPLKSPIISNRDAKAQLIQEWVKNPASNLLK